MRRARSTDQKEQRRGGILAAARAALAGAEPAMATMDALAAATGLAKGTLYLYFRTKEEVYLAVLREDLGAWLDEVEAAPPPAGAAGLAAALVKGLRERPVMTWLLARLATILEANLDVETARSFKLWIAGRIETAGSRLAGAVPGAAPATGTRLCLWIFALLVGIHQLAHPAPTVARVIGETPELCGLRVDFAGELEAALTALIGGMVRG
jgi:AcrR family transcriptional regulator